MRRAVIDTNLYIDWLNAGRHEAVLFEQDAVKYLSAVVMLELYAGAFSPRDRRLVHRVVRAFKQAGRILVPSSTVWEQAGHVLRALQKSRGDQVARSPSVVNDVLIALSARAIGATVVTSNARDFTAIREIRPFQLAVAVGTIIGVSGSPVPGGRGGGRERPFRQLGLYPAYARDGCHEEPRTSVTIRSDARDAPLRAARREEQSISG